MIIVKQGSAINTHGFWGYWDDYCNYVAKNYGFKINDYEWLWSYNVKDILLSGRAITKIDQLIVVLDFKLTKSNFFEASKFSVEFYKTSELRKIKIDDSFDNYNLSINFVFSTGIVDFVSSDECVDNKQSIIKFTNTIMK